VIPHLNNNKKLGIVVCSCYPSYTGGISRRITVQVSLGQKKKEVKKEGRKEGGGAGQGGRERRRGGGRKKERKEDWVMATGRASA
jgi:hypothetical protein